MFLRKCWYMVDWSHELPGDIIHKVTILNEPIAVYRNGSGELVALEDRCVHRLAPLSAGRIEGDDLRCMYHGLKFAPDGQCNEIPEQDVISPRVCVRSYPIVEKHGCAWIWMSKSSEADADLIPPIIGLDDPKWALKTATIEYNANASLIGDNLLDLSHVAWVHANSFGGGDEETAEAMKISEAKTKVTTMERGVKLQRWLPRPGNPFLDVGPTEDLIVNSFLAPGTFILTNYSYKAGAEGRQDKEFELNEEPVLALSTCQMITPVSDKKSKFFFTFGPWAKWSEIGEQAFKIAEMAFEEDRLIIEAQQDTMDQSPDPRFMSLAMDVPVVRYQTIFNRLLKQDSD